MRHGRRRGRLGLVQEHRRALLRNLARGLICSQRVVTTHARAKEASRFVDQLVTIAKQDTLHARRHLVRKLGSGSELLAKRMVETIAPKFSGRKGGYTRTLHYRTRPGDGASLSLLEFSVPVVEVVGKKPKKKKSPKAAPEEQGKGKGEISKAERPASEEAKGEKLKKETPKKGGFLSALRRFFTGDDEGRKQS